MLIEIVKTVLGALRSLFRSRALLLAENLVLRQQVAVLRRSVPKPRIRVRDRVLFALVARVFGEVVHAVAILRPETVVRWHRSFWRLVWRKKSGRPVGRPPIDADTRALIRRMWKENPLWGENVIAGELAKLVHHVSPRTVAKYRPANLPRGRGQKWTRCKRRREADGCHRYGLCQRGPCAAGPCSAGSITSTASLPELRARASTLAPIHVGLGPAGGHRLGQGHAPSQPGTLLKAGPAHLRHHRPPRRQRERLRLELPKGL